MTDKNKPPNSVRNAVSTQNLNESDKAFLDRTNVHDILNGLLDSLFHHQPADPLNYICNYFDNLSHHTDPVKRAYDRLSPISHTNAGFEECLLEIYDLFLTTVLSDKGITKKASKCILADLYNRLIDLLMSDLRADFVLELSVRLKRRDQDAFSFCFFKSAIRIIYLFKEFLHESTQLFTQLNSYTPNNQVNKQVAKVLADRLQNSLRILAPTQSNNADAPSSIKVIYELSPYGLCTTLSEKTSVISTCRDSISLEDFHSLIAKSFIEHIYLQRQ